MRDIDLEDEALTDEELESLLHSCERCGQQGHVELVPLMGYSEWLCRMCASAAYEAGEAI